MQSGIGEGGYCGYWVSLLPAFAVINITLALFYLGSRRMRIALLASLVVWLEPLLPILKAL